MKHKGLVLLLLAGVLTWLIPGRAYAQSDRSAGLAADQKVRMDQTVEVGVEISAGQGSYHAYDLELSYDREKLSFVSCTQEGETPEYWEENGKLRILGYGEAKTGSLQLRFRPLAAGTAEIRLQSAKVDNRAGAPSRDAPPAVISRALCVVTIGKEYQVTLEDGLTAQTLVACYGEDYLFRATDAGNYTYDPKATVEGKPVTVRSGGDGSFSIAGNQITGTLVIRGNRTAKSYRVTFTGTGAEGEATATYNTDYSFSVTPKSGYKYSVKINIGANAYTGYAQDGDTYTIPGTDITGSIIIAVTYTKTASTSTPTTTTRPGSTGSSGGTGGKKTVTFLGSGAKDASGESSATGSQDYTFTIAEKRGFSYEVTVKCGETVVAYARDVETGRYRVPAGGITENLTITINKIPKPQISLYLTLDRRYLYLVTFDGELEKGQVPLYEGRAMMKTEAYGGYGWLVVSMEEEDAFAKAAAYAITLGAGEEGGSACYTGDVDRSGTIDRQDGTLVLEMYNARYLLTDVDMLSFLNADLNGDRKLDIRDAVAVLYAAGRDGEVA